MFFIKRGKIYREDEQVSLIEDIQFKTQKQEIDYAKEQYFIHLGEERNLERLCYRLIRALDNPTCWRLFDVISLFDFDISPSHVFKACTWLVFQGHVKVTDEWVKKGRTYQKLDIAS